MLIKRNVYFSAIDEDGEERLYSTTEVMDEQDYIERLYAENHSLHDENLSKYQSGRGLGRSYFWGGVGGLGGTAAGNIAASIADRKGKTDEEQAKIAKATGTAVGAGIGAGMGALAVKSLRKNSKTLFNNGLKKQGAANRLLASKYGKGIVGAGMAAGALGAYLGTKKNTQARQDKRLNKEWSKEEVRREDARKAGVK
jgi:hypothetical protein